MKPKKVKFKYKDGKGKDWGTPRIFLTACKHSSFIVGSYACRTGCPYNVSSHVRRKFIRCGFPKIT